MAEPAQQLEFDLGASAPPDAGGLARWREEVRQGQAETARRLGLPLRERVQVLLDCGATLRGRLELNERELVPTAGRPVHLVLRIGGSVFEVSQVVSCVVTGEAAKPGRHPWDGGTSRPDHAWQAGPRANRV